ncbi:peptidoglycan-binding protein [Palleronia sediminis]|uniref:Peptidoglycan-binding protein n=2 Tax=Palleronia sediminis TaxID=2547833 RepID=A0A4R6AAW2_9RHOB|nr:peptidoglycan-binding protein [Palleronia sediminis]
MAVLLALLGACAPGLGPDVDRFREPELAATRSQRVDLSRPDICHSRDDTPAVIETVTEQFAETAPDGSISYRTETSQRIVENREEIWFETPCRDVWTEEFIAAVQRALIVRGYMPGPPSGEVDRATRKAIRAFQAGQGIDSDVLSIAGAKRLGLIVYDRDEALGR